MAMEAKVARARTNSSQIRQAGISRCKENCPATKRGGKLKFTCGENISVKNKVTERIPRA